MLGSCPLQSSNTTAVYGYRLDRLSVACTLKPRQHGACFHPAEQAAPEAYAQSITGPRECPEAHRAGLVSDLGVLDITLGCIRKLEMDNFGRLPDEKLQSMELGEKTQTQLINRAAQQTCRRDKRLAITY